MFSAVRHKEESKLWRFGLMRLEEVRGRISNNQFMIYFLNLN
jgi:hypothetical protein